jgi:DNA-binding SARP family transcriptional activator
VRIWLLGGFRVAVGPRTVGEEAWHLRKAATLVKLLALEPHHRLHREVVMEVLCPELRLQAAANNLYRALYFARGAFDPASSARRYIELRNEQLTLCPGGQLWVDVGAFEEAAAIARRSGEPAAYRAAIELYAGELLPEDRYEEWAEERRAQLRETFLELLVGLARSHEEREEYEKGIEALRKAVAEEPTRDETHAALMRLYALSGRRAEALGQYQRLEEILSVQLGTQPHSETRLLREEIASRRFPLSGQSTEEHPLEEHAGVHNLPLLRTSFVGRESEKKVLLVLDNCEHLVDAAASLADVLLGSCPRLKILATSREPLGVAGEIN